MEKLKELLKKRDELKSDFLWLCEQGKGVKFYTLGFLAISLISMLFSLASPIASKYVVDSAISGEGGFQLKYVLIMFLTSVFSIVLSFISNNFSNYVNEKFAFSVRAVMFDKTQRGKWKNITRYHSGDMLARLNGDVDNIASNIISILPNIIITFLQLLIILFILLKFDPALVAIGLIVGPLGMVLSIVLRKPYQKYQKTLRESQSEYYTFFQEVLGNLGVVKAFQTEEKNNERFEEIRKRRLKTVIRSSGLSTAMSSAMRFVYGTGYVIAFCHCARQLNVNPAYTYGTMTLFLSLVSQLQGSISSLGGIIPKIYSTLVSTKRVREITEQMPESSAADDPIPDAVGLSVKDICFSYDDETVLKNLDFSVAPNEKVGIVGSSGTGKTTFIRLLLALIEPDSGKLFFTHGENEEEEVTTLSRRLLSYVPQGNTLMTGTLRDNLLIGDSEATDEMMWEALRKADAEGFVRRDPLGLDMKITEKSGGLSAGQAQRICIARALLRKRPVLILDEATSALDEATERRIFETLSAEENRTCFIITHRSSMLRYCTSVIRINDNGEAEYSKC